MIKHLLTMDQLSSTDINTILDTAESLRSVTDRPIKKLPTLRGRTVCNLFYEASTRTRISFELAAKRLSADVINFSADSKSSVAKGESFKDTAWTLEAMGVDAIIVRHGSSGAPHQLSQWVKASVLNAGDGQHEHPTQALLDLYSMREPLHVRPRDPRMENVSDDRDLETLEILEVLAHRKKVQQGLGRVLVLSITRVQDACLDPLRQLMRRT